MIPGRICGNCSAFSALTKECRANPPVAHLFPGAGGQVINMGVFPSTREENWCNKWEKRVDDVNSSQ